MTRQVTKARSGVLAGGNWIVDQVKMIDVFPQVETLANISSSVSGTGGAPYNVLLGLAKSGAPFPLTAAGLVGNDATGKEILKTCREHKIDTKLLKTTTKAPTSYTDVMTEQGSGPRSQQPCRSQDEEISYPSRATDGGPVRAPGQEMLPSATPKDLR